MPSQPLFSVIIATYERPDFLSEAVDSVMRQTVVDFELQLWTTPARRRQPSPWTPGRLIRRERNEDLRQPGTAQWSTRPVRTSPSWATTTGIRPIGSNWLSKDWGGLRSPCVA